MFPRLSSSALFSVALLAVSAIGSAHADTLLIDRVKQERSHAVPSRGLSMAQVERQYGAPLHKLTPAGGDSRWHPTINRWVYANYTVYFERDHVIDAVVNRASPEEIGPKNAAYTR
jgi:hypothetical protein